jgi:uncharacterized protein (TIGR01777 family)
MAVQPEGPLRILVSGASGFIGTELCRQLEHDGHTVVKLVRRPVRSAAERRWMPDRGEIDPAALEAADAVINLSGAPTARIPWTPAYKREIAHSRVEATRTLAEAMRRVASPPATFLSAAGVGYYGDRPGETLDESSSKGAGFLAEVVDRWEKAAHLAPEQTRVVTLRTGLVVAKGGAFTPIGLATKVGLGTNFGTGQQRWPWISLYDEAAAIRHLLTSSLSGPVNLAGPTPATADAVTKRLALAMHRPRLLRIPRALLEFALNGPATELVFPSQRVIPKKLLEDGFEFAHKTVEDAIQVIWGKAG